MMNIVLTHEQADFDALASMLGAYLLDDTAIPVLPRRMNRNVRAFLSVYGEDLPFIDPRDLPNQTVEHVTLVDTQSMVSIRGMSADTLVDVVDHHPEKGGLPTNWIVTILDIGASTTILVDILREKDIRLTTLQSTLLLLGIYEDTGSLTYSRTTSQDLRAAAFLVEQGASLRITSQFINHPLSPVQQALYDRLRGAVHYHQIHGHTIVVACGDDQSMDEELSSIAHKLRDLLDPDALFLVVTTRGGIQLIARSTNDKIDVSSIIAHFGGGGHERAAAGLVRGRNLQDICSELVELLPEHIHPAVTVAQVMSRDPQLISSDLPAKDVAERMRRYGYEGFPVVQKGRVVGLINRRAVDRAISHRLVDMTAGQLMDKGQHFVNPGDSIEKLQHVVVESGWGQIPVVDPQSGQVIGIVTRTDLLKSLSPQPKLPGHLNLADRLEAVLPDGRMALLKAIASIAHEKRAALYIVGGFVRDLILEVPSLDFDLVVEGDAAVLARALSDRYGGRVTGHSRFSTAKWHLSNQSQVSSTLNVSSTGFDSIDLVSARIEFYTYPTALPTVEKGSIKLDLHRRDFTINTLALRLDGRHYGELHDYWGGLNDLRQKLVRVLHSLSFVDDPTRILRAIRFEQRFGFLIEERSLELLLEARPLIEHLSGDRIRKELDHILGTPHAVSILDRLVELGLLKIIHPNLAWDPWLKDKFLSLNNLEIDPVWGLSEANPSQTLIRDLAYILWLIRLPVDQASSGVNRLRLPVRLSKIILTACTLWREQVRLFEASPSQIVQRLEDIPPISCYGLFLATSNEQLRQNLYEYMIRWRKVSPTVSGSKLKMLGLPPGPIYRQIIDTLRNAWLDGQISSVQEEQDLLNIIIQKSSQK
jgi:tRNA nucleotidyltransferase (CCA-adding enzyme)